MNWSQFQLAIFAAVASIFDVGRDLVIRARAGTGKTTTAIEAVIRFAADYPRKRVILAAFNKRIAQELQARLADAGLRFPNHQASTLHSMGLAACKRKLGKGLKVDGSKGRKIAKQVAREVNQGLPPDQRIERGQVAKLVGLAKGTLARTPGQVEGLCWRYGVADTVEQVPHLVSATLEAMSRSKADESCVDFDDMIWFPHVIKGIWPWQADLVLVDEAQDMNPAQLKLARMAVKRGGHLVAIGDDRQAIYGWRGADSDFLDRLIDESDAIELPLPVTYRCGTTIVAEAVRLVPDYQAGPDNAEGTVRASNAGEMMSHAGPGDFVLSRVNAPLMGLLIDFLKDGKPAVIQGRDLLSLLSSIIERSQTETTVELLSWLEVYQSEETAKLMAVDADEQVIENFIDRCECVRALAPEHETVDGLLLWMERLFTDMDDSQRITLSTAHRAKGLERDRVWMLNNFREDLGGQEANVAYVAITRAKSELVYVRMPKA